jgi:O-antigen/teichoic acid export membrane protein
VHGQPDGQSTFQRVFLLIMLALVIVGTALSVMARDILRVMAAPSFYSAATVIPIVVAAYVVRSAGDFAGFGIRMSERTVHFLHASIFSVAVMTVGYMGLIPRWGGVGAAIATFVGMLAEMLWIQYKANQLVPLDLPWGRVIVASGLGVVAYGMCQLLAPDTLVASILFRTVMLALFTAVVFFSPIVGPAERDACYRLLRDITHRVRGVLSVG